MTEDARLEDGAARLEQAISALEAAAVKQKQTTKSLDALRSEIGDLRAGRAKLAEQLDAADSRNAQQASVTQEISGRIDTVMDNIRLLLSGV